MKSKPKGARYRSLTVEPLARMIMGSMNEAARLIAHASDKERARREVGESANRMWNGLRVDATR